MKLTDLQRLKKVVKWLIFSDFGDNEKEIAELLGYKKASFSQLMNGKVPLSDKFIDKLISLDNNINKVWIKTGEGSMLKSEPQPAVSSSQPQENDNNEIVSLLKDKIALLEKNNALQERENAYLSEKIKNLQEELTQLKKQTKSPVFSPAPVR